jgi:hypothetical protein
MMPHDRPSRRRSFFPNLEQFEEFSSPTPLSGAAAALAHSPPHPAIRSGDAALRLTRPHGVVVVHGVAHAVDLPSALVASRQPERVGRGGLVQPAPDGDWGQDVLADSLDDLFAGHAPRRGQGQSPDGTANLHGRSAEMGAGSGLLSGGAASAFPTVTQMVRPQFSAHAPLSQDEAELAARTNLVSAAPALRTAQPRGAVSHLLVQDQPHRAHGRGHGRHHLPPTPGGALLPPLPAGGQLPAAPPPAAPLSGGPRSYGVASSILVTGADAGSPP